MTCEGTKHRFNLSRLADGDAPWLCECGAVEWMEENGNLDCVALDLEKVLRTAQEVPVGYYEDVVRGAPYWADLTRRAEQDIERRRVQPDHLIEPPKE